MTKNMEKVHLFLPRHHILQQLGLTDRHFQRWPSRLSRSSHSHLERPDSLQRLAQTRSTRQRDGDSTRWQTDLDMI